MDSPTAKKCQAIEAEVDNILDMYSDVEKVMPYSTMHGDQFESDNFSRLSQTKFATDDAPEHAIRKGSALPLLFTFLMSRAHAKSLFDFSPFFKKPARCIGFLFLGQSVWMMH